MDFFTVVADPSQPIIHNDRPQDNANDSFAEAIANRFGSGALLTARLTPVSLAPPTLRLPASPMANMSLATPTPRNPTNSSAPPPAAPGGPLQFSTITPATLGPWTDDPTALILDIRAHAAYSTARVPCAVSLSVPSTLLKRPLFSLHRLADMLPSANARARFSSWRSASCILVYDADSSSVSESSNIYGLLRKFKNDGFQGDLAWLKGGFQAVWREKRDIIDAHPPTPDVENDDDDDDVVKSASPTQPQSTVLRTRNLPMSAFSLSSTTVSSSPVLNPTNPKRGPIARGATFPALPTPSQNQPQPAMNPFFDAVRQNLELSQGITERIPLRLPRRVRHRIHDLPFPWLREIARRAAKLAPRCRSVIDSASSASEESEDDENTTSADVEEGKEALAMQFFKIEVAEQRRLMGIMEHHTKETMIVTSDVGATPSPSNFPYSITAGVEKGAKNRYRHIWPFEHARVRLHQRREADDDYVNASYVQPLGTNKRYIATQGPLPATFTDFWTLCWEQNVHVIVMLTKEVENSMVKCGSYWTESEFGPLRLRLISTTGASPPEEPSLFPTPPVNQHHLTSPPSHITQQQLFEKQTSRQRTRRNQIIRRVFELTHTGYPEALPRRIVHLQYLEWPDLNVPDDPRGLLELLRQVDDAVKETHGHGDPPPAASSSTAVGATPSLMARTEVDEKTGISKQALGRNRPVMLHCSAGVGRTGGFIAVDVVLDAIRREMRASDKRPERDTDENAMDVDVPSGSTPGPIITSSVATVKDGPMSNEELPKETISLTIAAGNGCHESERGSGYVVHVPVIPTPTSDGTDPDASGSERENPLCDQTPSATTLKKQTRAWAETVSRADHTTIDCPGATQQRSQERIFESELNGLSPSKNEQLTLSSDTSSSSNHSLLDLSGTNGRRNTDTSDHYPFLQSSSFATSIAAVSSPEPSPPRNELDLQSSKSLRTSSATPAFLSIDHVSVRPVSEPLVPSRPSINDVNDASPRPRAEVSGKDLGILPQSSGWLGEPLRNRSPSPMARTTSGDSATSPRSRSVKPSFTLRAPPYTGGISSDAEPPSRSVSPSADEGSVASQVSSYHSLLKKHHHQPLHTKSLPISLDKPDKGKSTRHLRVPAPVPERQTSPLLGQTAANGQSSESATVVDDFKRPRPLHGTATPPNLTLFEEPVFEVVQDMREQRMSLCQSLRQYVFVHAAILEGALMIVDEERELVKERKRERTVEMSGLKIESERQEKAVISSRVVPLEATVSGRSDAGGSKGSLGVSSRLYTNPYAEDSRAAGVSAPEITWGSGSRPLLGQSDMISMSTSPAHPSPSTVVPSQSVQDEGEGYFANFISQPPTIFGLSNEDSVDESAMESVFSPRPRVPAGLVFPPAIPVVQRPRHSVLDARFGKRSTSPSDYFRDRGGPLSLDDDAGLFKRPSVKRKQPSGEAGEIMTRKRAQNKSSSRERERERQLEGRLSNSSHSHPRDGAVDILTSGLVQ